MAEVSFHKKNKTPQTEKETNSYMPLRPGGILPTTNHGSQTREEER